MNTDTTLQTVVPFKYFSTLEEVRNFSVVDGIPEGYPDMALGILENTPVWGFYTQEWGDEYPTLRARHPVDEPCLHPDMVRRLQEADPDEFREIVS